MKSIGILFYLVETDISGKGKDTLLVEQGKVYFWTFGGNVLRPPLSG
jgi:hypothetical protein